MNMADEARSDSPRPDSPASESRVPAASTGDAPENPLPYGRGSDVNPAVKRPVLRFVVCTGLLMVLYYAVTVTPSFKDWFFPPIHRANTQLVVGVLKWFGEDVSANDRQIVTADLHYLEVRRGCDAVEPIALFVAVVLAFPLPFRSKWLAILLGIAALLFINLIRIVTLYWVWIKWPSVFDVMHTQVWQALFIFLAIGFWITWVWREMRTRAVIPDGTV